MTHDDFAITDSLDEPDFDALAEGYEAPPEDDHEGVLADDQMARLLALMQVCKMAPSAGMLKYRSSEELIRLAHWIMTGDPHMVEAEG